MVVLLIPLVIFSLPTVNKLILTILIPQCYSCSYYQLYSICFDECLIISFVLLFPEWIIECSVYILIAFFTFLKIGSYSITSGASILSSIDYF